MSPESLSPCTATTTPPIDAVIGGYVSWREKSVLVAATYETWTSVRSDGRAIAFAEYVAALDREERAASEYQRLVEQAAA